MKLLLDQNLSRRILPFLQSHYPGSSQTAVVGLETADDLSVWRYAQNNGFVIVTRDADFSDLAAAYGAPPAVIWLRGGNLDKSQTIALLLQHQPELLHALEQEGKSLAEIWA